MNAADWLKSYLGEESYVRIKAKHLTLQSATVKWKWPRWLRWIERIYRHWSGNYEVVYQFEVKPEVADDRC